MNDLADRQSTNQCDSNFARFAHFCPFHSFNIMNTMSFSARVW